MSGTSPGKPGKDQQIHSCGHRDSAVSIRGYWRHCEVKALYTILYCSVPYRVNGGVQIGSGYTVLKCVALGLQYITVPIHLTHTFY